MSKRSKRGAARGQVIQIDQIRGFTLKSAQEVGPGVQAIVFKNRAISLESPLRATRNAALVRRNSVKGFRVGQEVIHAGQIEGIQLAAGRTVAYASVACFKLPGGGTTPPPDTKNL